MAQPQCPADNDCFLQHKTRTRKGCAGKQAEASHTVGGLQVGIAGGAVGGGVVTEVEEESEHLHRRDRLDGTCFHIRSWLAGRMPTLCVRGMPGAPLPLSLKSRTCSLPHLIEGDVASKWCIL
jgi:hypothetical protein